jgi:phosphoribosylformylglycinamidine synthase
MSPVEVMTSESQERMLAIVTPQDLAEVEELCERWDIRASVVGRVTDTGRFRVFDDGLDGALLADVPVGSLGDGPSYDRPRRVPDGHDARSAADPGPVLDQRFGPGTDVSGELLELLADPTIADKRWVWEQYDHQLFLNTVVGPGADATVLRLKGTGRSLALATDGNARFCALDPRVGGRLVVLEAARNVACAGGRPLALVNCLNFGNPEHPEIMWQFSEVIDGMAEACRALDLPVVGGNVSFYNESVGVDIDPTPVVGVIGIIEGAESVPPPSALTPGAVIAMLGHTEIETGGSVWAHRHGLVDGAPPAAALDAAARLHTLVRALASDAAVVGIHDCSDGGIAVTLAEMAIAGGTGFVVEGDPRPAWWFSESASRVVVAVDPTCSEALAQRATDAGVEVHTLGSAGGDRLKAPVFDVTLADAAAAWTTGLPHALDGMVQS